MITKRDLVTCILLTIVTFGIYGLIWFFRLSEDLRKLTGDSKFEGLKCLVLNIITFGIYGIYWAYIAGQAIDNLKQERGSASNYGLDNSILYLILAFVGLGIVSWCLLQDELNKIADSSKLLEQKE
ncbi:MAG: DUF4234 domain-containing protein [Erysipelotrichales bacterium]|nr:DUF4234 domain-containing protein [Erysipelotrichales bacterium]